MESVIDPKGPKSVILEAKGSLAHSGRAQISVYYRHALRFLRHRHGSGGREGSCARRIPAKEAPGRGVRRSRAIPWNPAIIESHLGGQGLFSNKYIVFVDRVTENKDAKESLVDFVPAVGPP